MFAGEVFPQWYWGPIFFALLYGPPLLAIALVAWRFGGRGLAAGVLVGGVICVLVGRELVRDVRFNREARAAAQAFDFQPYAPSPLPRPFTTELAGAFDGALVSRYGAGPGAYAFAYQQTPADVSLRDGRCELHRLKATGTNFYEGPCRQLRTRGGRDVYIGRSTTHVVGDEAFALLDGTLVRMQVAEIPERDVLAYFDSLRPVGKDDLEFKRG